MHHPFLALITPLGVPDVPPQPQPPGGIWGGGNVPMPSPPIQLPPWLITGAPPPGIWGGGNVPMPSPPIWGAPGAPGWQPPQPQPPGIWGGGNVPMPSPPIQLPPWLISGGQPPGIWGGGGVPMPNPPIANVPGAPGYNPDGPPIIWGGGNVPFPDVPIYIPEAPGVPPVVVIPPNDRPLPPIPPKPEVAESAKTLLVLKDNTWNWLVLSPPYEPPENPLPAPKVKR